MATTVWSPLEMLQESPDVKNLALVILNRPLEPLQKVLEALWNKAILKVAVDGGAVRLERLAEDKYIPDVLTGDFDSCSTDTVRKFKGKGVEVIETPDQDFTDFTKSLQLVAQKVNCLQECKCVMVLGAFDGRLDHVLANINTLFEVREVLTKPVLLYSGDSVAFLLMPGHHQIKVQTGLEEEWCGLIPIGEPCREITTTGLKWNLDRARLKFGELISTSNTYDGSGDVTVMTSDPVLWTMGYHF